MCHSDVRAIDWVPRDTFTVVIAHALFPYISYAETCDVVFQLVGKTKIGGRLYFGYLSDCPTYAQVMSCLARIDVDVMVAREDHLYENGTRKGQYLWAHKSQYFNVISVIVTVLSRSPPLPQLLSEPAPPPKYPKNCPQYGPYAVAYGAGLSLRFRPRKRIVDVFGKCCTGRMIFDHTVCYASPVYTQTTHIETVSDCPTIASCGARFLEIAKAKCGCEGTVCDYRMLTHGKKDGKKA